MNWWGLFHQMMRDLQWTPDQIGRLTILQMSCLLSEKPPAPELTDI